MSVMAASDFLLQYECSSRAELTQNPNVDKVSVDFFKLGQKTQGQSETAHMLLRMTF